MLTILGPSSGVGGARAKSLVSLSALSILLGVGWGRPTLDPRWREERRKRRGRGKWNQD